MKTAKLLLASLLMTSFAFVSCDKDGESNDNEPKSMRVRMTDAPGDYAKLEVEIAKVEVYGENSGWVTLQNESQIVSVLDLTNGAEVELASETKLKSDTYTELRLTYGSNNKVWVNTEASSGESFITAAFDLEMNMPEKQTTITIDQTVDKNSGSDILLDFNVAESVSGTVLTSFVLDPEITVIEDEETGIRGEVEGSENTAIMVEGNGRTYSTYADSEGRFLIRGMAAGTYDVTFMPTEDDLPEEVTIEGVVVTDGEINNTGKVEIEG